MNTETNTKSFFETLRDAICSLVGYPPSIREHLTRRLEDRAPTSRTLCRWGTHAA